MNNLEIYEKTKAVPDNAQREIQAGRLKGKTDINPMWRIKVLTEIFGPCGFGWRYEIVNKRLEPSADTHETAAFVDINLYIKYNGEWSGAIPGTGGSSFVAKEKNGLYLSDECFKMALTDAISVACKALGIGADVYWEADKTKYEKQPQEDVPKPTVTRTEVPDPNTHSRQFAVELKANGKTTVDGLQLIESFFGKRVKLDEVEDAVFNEFTEQLPWNL